MHIFYFNTVILVIKIKERRKKRAEVHVSVERCGLWLQISYMGKIFIIILIIQNI